MSHLVQMWDRVVGWETALISWLTTCAKLDTVVPLRSYEEIRKKKKF